uniref:Bm13102, isoform b n=1 Tax=Brugia malayi TaxID=6279 RepID=A0A1I9G2B6_BRUMA|nr:Bm13102, isoform b [Brugia malayi]
MHKKALMSRTVYIRRLEKLTLCLCSSMLNKDESISELLAAGSSIGKESIKISISLAVCAIVAAKRPQFSSSSNAWIKSWDGLN